jgi:magnesium transporter
MVHPLFGPELRQMLAENDAAEMRTFCETLHPATVAEALTEEYSVEDVWRVLQHTDIPKQAEIFEYFPMEWQVKLAEGSGRPQMAKLIEQMSHDDRVDLLRRLPPLVSEGLLRLVDEADRRDIALLTKYPENTAGALMTSEYAWLPGNISAAEALEKLRLQAPNSETIYYIYVLDDGRRLLGVLSLRNLILANRAAVVRDIMEQELVSVRATDDREKVAKEMRRYDLLAMPVLDAEGRMLGIVTHDDVIDVVEEAATEDIHRMGAVQPMAENYLEANFVQVWRNRAVWLSWLFVAELFTFSALAFFESAISEVVVLALFVPLCISTGGNSGSQAATLVTRAIALGQIGLASWWRVLRHELFMGIALGLTLGTIGFVRGAMTKEEILRNPVTRIEAFEVRVPLDQKLEPVPGDNGEPITVELPPGSKQLITEQHRVLVTLPDASDTLEPEERDGMLVYRFPAKSTLRHEAIDRWRLAIVISQAVALICLWGTLVGSMLPLIFRRIGVDPGVASSPFVATFVDVTGIIIYFTVAKAYLL